MKECTSCKVSKALSEFYVRKSGRSAGKPEAKCKDCIRARVNSYARDNREPVRARNRIAGQKFRAQNAESERARAAEYRAANSDLCRARVSRWQKENPDKRTANETKRRSMKLNATPSWANLAYIALFYELARTESERIGVDVHVDHIVPLKSKTVCGLHCEHNLQLLVASDNIRKSNRYWPDMPNTRGENFVEH